VPAISELIGEGLSTALRALTETPIGKAAGQTAEDLAATPKPIPQNVPEAPFAGSPERQPYIRATAAPEQKTVWDGVQAIKTNVGSAFTAEANAPSYIKNLFHAARMASDEAQGAADEVLGSRVVSQLDPAQLRMKGRLLSDYATQASDYADLKSKLEQDPSGAYTGLGGATIDQVQADLYATTKQVQQHPDVVLAYKAFRNVMDEAFDVMKSRGYVTDEQYRQAYTPLQKLDVTVRELGRLSGEDPGGMLDAMQHRDSVGQLRETSVLKIARKTLGNLYQKIAEDELASNIFNDPTLDRTTQFADGQRLPVGWTRYQPRPGLPGWLGGPEQETVAGLMDGFQPNRGRVIPEDLANRLKTFRPAQPSHPVERSLYRAASQLWRWLTVGNPANLGLNLPSDATTAMIGMPGERSNIAATIQLMPDSYVQAVKGAFGAGRNPEYDRALQAGLGEATQAQSIMGERIPTKLAEAAGVDQLPQSWYMTFMQKLRQGTELGPRMAAARANAQRILKEGGTPEQARAEYERVGQAITGDFGAGAPALTRVPIARFAAPFLRFSGFAVERVAKLLTMKGSRARAWTAVLGVPFAAMAWNHQNPEYEQAEYQIPAYDRNRLHFLRPNADGSLWRDPKTGQPQAVRFRYFLPEEVLSMFGAGNLPSRLLEVTQGRKGLSDVAGEMADQSFQTVGSQLVPAQVATELATGRNLQTGEPESRVDAARKLVPILEQVNKTARAAEGGDAHAVLATGLSQITGVKPTGMSRADADLLDIESQFRDAKSKLRSALRKQDAAAVNDARAEMARLENRSRAINTARRGAR